MSASLRAALYELVGDNAWRVIDRDTWGPLYATIKRGHRGVLSRDTVEALTHSPTAAQARRLERHLKHEAETRNTYHHEFEP